MTLTTTTTVDIPSQPAGPPATWQLVELAKAGDRNAFAELYRLYNPTVRRFLFPRLGRDLVLVDDVASDTWLRALRSIPRIEFVGRDFGAWIITIARNLVADHYKSGWSSRVSTTGDLVGDEPDGDDLEAGVLARLGAGELLAALATLPDAQRDVLRLRFLEQLDVAETATALGVTVGACKALQYRAVRTLARTLGVTRC